MSNDQFTKLEKYLDERFDIMEQRFDFTEQYMRGRFDAVDERFDKVDARFDRLEGVVDTLAADVSTVKDELAVHIYQTTRRLDQHQSWIGQLADCSQVKLDYST